MKTMTKILPLFGLVVLVAACGGGGGDAAPTPQPPAPPPPSPPPAAATITGLSVQMLADAAAPLRYRGQALVTVTGSNLDGAALTFGGTACTLGAAPAGFSDSATARYRACTLVGVGAQQLTVAVSDNVVAQSVSFTVPQPQVTLNISANGSTLGSLVLTLDPARAPITVDNFLAYAAAGFYDGTAFHRHAPNFVLQGGGYAAPITTTTLPAAKATNPPIALEVGRGLSNVQYSVAMARTSELNSATSQFFINLVNNAGLDTAAGGYAVFGSVTAGTDLVEQMRTATCLQPNWLSPGECVPVPNLVVASASQTR
jgi:cyclophilin family peptidyl-prolyl cis-trans isomerase